MPPVIRVFGRRWRRGRRTPAPGTPVRRIVRRRRIVASRAALMRRMRNRRFISRRPRYN